MTPPNSLYNKVFDRLRGLDPEGRYYHFRRLARTDLYFLLRYVLGRHDVEHPWIWARCLDVQEAPDGHLDLWARAHYKSTLITYGKTIQDILASHGDDPLPAWDGQAPTFGLFSHTRPIAKGFLRQIKREFEANIFLRNLFPDVIWDNPTKEAPKWGEDDGIILKRRSNPKESTVEAWGLVDGQPTSRHFDVMVYDDVVTLESVSNPDMINKTTDRWEISTNLATERGVQRYIGTRYHDDDTYRVLIDRGVAQPRIYPATEDGTANGVPVLLEPEALAKRRRDMTPYNFACHGAGTMITMADWSQRRIEEVRPGDMVVGVQLTAGEKARLIAAPVIAINNRLAEAVQSIMADASINVHTPDHKWLGRAEKRRPFYSTLGLGYHQLSSLRRVYDRLSFLPLTSYQREAGAYLAGVFDGEGSMSGKIPTISQDDHINRSVCDAIESALDFLEIPYRAYRKKRKGRIGRQVEYKISGGLSGRLRFYHCIAAWSSKASRIPEACFRGLKSTYVQLVDQRPIGEVSVYNIQTGTGNYIANGFVSKNCQLLLDPIPADTAYFRSDWVQYYDQLPEYVTYWAASDYAVTEGGGDYTVHGVVAVDPEENIYLVDWWRQQTDAATWVEACIDLGQRYKPILWAEESGQINKGVGPFLQKRMRERSAFFAREQFVPSTNKATRAQSIRGRWAMGKVYLPRAADWVSDLVAEMIRFPVGRNDDQVDVMGLFGLMLDKFYGQLVPKPEKTHQGTGKELLDIIGTMGQHKAARYG